MSCWIVSEKGIGLGTQNPDFWPIVHSGSTVPLADSEQHYHTLGKSITQLMIFREFDPSPPCEEIGWIIFGPKRNQE